MTYEKRSSILDYQVIDGIYEEDGKAILAINDHLDWSDHKGHVLHLARKLDTYRCYIESGELGTFNDCLKGKPVVIKWFVDPDIPEEAQELISKERVQLFRIAQLYIPEYDKEPIDPLAVELYRLLCRPLPKDQNGNNTEET